MAMVGLSCGAAPQQHGTMKGRLLFWVTLVVTAHAAPAPPTPRPDVYDPHDPPNYEFEYGVHSDDPAYGEEATKYGQQEARDGHSTAGSYQVLLPDSRTQTVYYTVDGDGGYQASVEYDGEADGSAAYSVPVYKPRARQPEEPGRYQYAPARSYEAVRKPVKSAREGKKAASAAVKEAYAPDGGVLPTYGAKVSSGSAASYQKRTTTTTTTRAPPPTTRAPPPTTYAPPTTTYAPPTATYGPPTTRAPAPKSVRITSRPTYVAPSVTRAPAQKTTPTSHERARQRAARLLWPAAAPTTPATPIFAGEKLRLARVPAALFRSEVERVHTGSGDDDKGRPHRGEPADPADDVYLEPDMDTLQALKILEESERQSNFGAKIKTYSDKAPEERKTENEYRPVFATKGS